MNDLTKLAFINSFIDKKYGLTKNKTLNVVLKYDTSKVDGSPTCNFSFEEIANALKSGVFVQFQCVEYSEDENHYRYICPHSIQINGLSEIIVHVFEGGSPTFVYTQDKLSVSLIAVDKL